MLDHELARDLGEYEQLRHALVPLAVLQERVAGWGHVGPKRRRSIRTMIAQAEKAGKKVASITTPEGVTLRFGEADNGGDHAANEWDEVYGKSKAPTRQ